MRSKIFFPDLTPLSLHTLSPLMLYSYSQVITGSIKQTVVKVTPVVQKLNTELHNV